MPQLKSQKLPNFSFEKRLWRRGFKFVVGIDEVGRGAWAGTIVTSAVVFPKLKTPQEFARAKNCGEILS